MRKENHTIKSCILSLMMFNSLFIGNLSIVNAQQKESARTISGEASIDVPSAKIRIIYPKGILLSMEPRMSPEVNRGGSLVSVEFNIEYKNIWLHEILFHTLESCRTFAKEYEKIEDSGLEGFPARWYSPEDFIQERKAFYSTKPSPDYKFININSVKYNKDCYFSEPGGFYHHEFSTFIDDIRAKIIIGSDIDCEKISNDVKQLLSKIKFRKLGSDKGSTLTPSKSSN